MAGADSSIYSMIRPYQQGPGPLDQYAQGMQLRSLIDNQGLNQLKRQQLERGIADEEATAAAYREAQGDPKKVRDLLYGRGLHKQGMAADAAAAKAAADRATVGKTKAEALAKNIGNLRNMAATVADDGSLAVLRETAMQMFGPDVVRNMPQTVNDPNFKQWQTAQIMDADKLLERLSPKLSMTDTGGQIIPTNPYTGAAGGVAIAKTMTPDARANAVTVPDETGAYQPNRPVINARSQIAAAGKPRITTNILPPQKTFENEDKLRADYTANPMVKSSAEMKNAFGMIEAAYQRPSAANDLAMATKYMKILDPTSVVRESEFALAVNATGLLDKVQNYAASVLQGKKLNPTQRKDFYDSAKAINDAFQAERQKVDDQYSEMATGYGLNPKNVIPSLRSKKPDAGKPTPQARKTVGGKNYVQIDGNWFEE